MTNQKMLEILYEIEKCARFEDICALRNAIEDAEKVLKEDVRTEIQKKKGNGNRLTLIKRLLKNNLDARPVMKNYYQPCGEQFGFTDPYRAYVLNENYGYENGAEHGEPMDILGCKPKGNDIKIEIDRADLEMFVADCKAKKMSKADREKIPYVIENKKIRIGFNADYLLDFCKMFNTNVLYCKDPRTIAYYENEQGEWGIALPG